ncbi:MAG: helix-turn-helix domain-containing protein [Bacillota bacterium]
MDQASLATTVADLLSDAEAAARAKVSVTSIRNWIKRGKLSAVKLGWAMRISRSELDAFLAKRGGKVSSVATEGTADEQR